jgi:hypothetical protein
MGAYIFLFFGLLSFHLGASEAHWFEAPKREMSIIVTDEGYYPRHFSVFRGEQIRFYLTNLGRQDSCFMLPEHEVFVPIKRHEFRVIEVSFSTEKTVSFHCPVGEIKGSVTVLEHPRDRNKQKRRSLASEVQQQHPPEWMPRDK